MHTGQEKGEQEGKGRGRRRGNEDEDWGKSEEGEQNMRDVIRKSSRVELRTSTVTELNKNGSRGKR